MDSKNRKTSEMKSLKKMRHDLELATEQMTSELEKLQDDSQKQNEQISETLEAVQREQQAANAILQSDWSENDSIASGLLKQIESWAVSDVISWLQNKNLHKFIILFQKHRVTGKDLLDLRLPFLESYDHISLEERELLLSEIYTLLNPTTVNVSEEDLTKIKSPLDRQKYLAAIELAQSRNSALQKSSSVLVLPTQCSTSKSSSSNQSSPAPRPRHKSESGSGGKLQVSTLEFKLSDTKKRKTLPKIKKSHTAPSLYECISSYGPQCIRCVSIPKQPDGRLGITMTTDNDGHMVIGQVADNLRDMLHTGDRVLELNGHQLKGPCRELAAILKERSNHVQLIVLSPCQTRPLVGAGNGYSEENWTKLRSLLVDMRDSDSSSDVPASLSTDQLQYLKHTAALQDDVKKSQERLKEKETECEKLKIELEDKAAMMHDLEVSRDKAIEKLKQTRGRVKQRNSRESLGGEEYYNMTMESLQPDSSSKDEVLDALKDIVKEASKQKWYLDRLISLVIEESPWLLDEVDSEFDHLTLTDQTEEFC